MHKENLSDFPQSFVVSGSSIEVVNGTYSISGIKNNRPFYQKEGAALWFFQGRYLSKGYTGWYLSKHVGTSNSSAADDFFTAYSHELLPPTDNWVTRGPNPIPALSGSGVDPPPKVERKTIEGTESCQTISMYPERYTIQGAGTDEVNSEYTLVGIINKKPCYQAKNGTSLFYFHSPIFPVSQYNGWYISKKLNTSQLSAKDDYYSAYVDMPLPPTNGWTTRTSGLMPSSGCGKNPPPRVEISLISNTNSIPIAIQSSEAVATSFEQQYLVEGAGNPIVNGKYCYSGIFNGKPFYTKQTEGTKEDSSILWYFTANVFPISTFTGWHISSELSSSSLSGASDYYSAYVRTPFPPCHGWATRKATSFTGGKGLVPAPTVTRIDMYEQDVPEQAPDLFSLSAFIKSDITPYFPGVIQVTHAGNDSINGIYEYCDWFHERPYYLQRIEDGSSRNSLAFFKTTSKYGWAFSDLNLRPDRCTYIVNQNSMGPPEAGWAVDKGQYPPPSVTICPSVKLIRICIHYQTESFFIVCSREKTISDVMILIQPLINSPIALYQLSIHDRVLNPDATLLSQKILHGFHLHLSPRKISSLVPNDSLRNILIVGGGPVGLWNSILLKLLAPQCDVTVKEKRSEYQRHHALRIEKHCLEGLQQFQELSPLYEVASQFYPRTRTSIVEKQLSLLASSIGVKLCYLNEVVNYKDNEGYQVVICCDGARSEGRKMLSPQNEFKVNETLGSLLQIKFEAIGQVSKASGSLAKFMQNLPAKQQFFNVLPANPDPETNTTPITIFSLINTDICKELSNNLSDKPIVSMEELKERLASPSQKLSEDIQSILVTACPDGIVESSLRISVLPASYYITEKVCGQLGLTPMFLLGDAAMGLSLEKGLNFGWKISTAFIQTLLFTCSPNQSMEFFRAYFQMISNSAVAQVQSDYAAYETLVARASLVRTILQKMPFVKTE